MNTLTDREKWDIQRISGDKDYFCTLPERHKTVAVSMAAVSVSGQNLEYVPETVIDREICRAALGAKVSDCSILPYIPFPDVQKEGIQRFASDTPAFVLYSFADIQDAKMALEAVKADAYCLQLVPSELLTQDLCKTALKSPNADEKVSQFVIERFPDLKMERTPNTGVKMNY
jgi:hypothetical protein